MELISILSLTILLTTLPPINQTIATDRSIVRNGFTLEAPLVPIEDILPGGPPRDGIPAINNPRLIQGYEATYLAGTDRVLGIVIDGSARAYPIRIMNWHEIVNDKVEGSS